MRDFSQSVSHLRKSPRTKALYLAQTSWLCLSLALIVGVVCAIILYLQKDAVTLMSADYTFCKQKGSNVTCQSIVDSQMSFDRPYTGSCRCEIDLNLPVDVQTDRIYIYYGLSKFNQNYRFLAQSRSDTQLKGDIDTTPSNKCFPRRSQRNESIVPCGSLANLMFDDEFEITNQGVQFSSDRYNIVFGTSRGYRYKNPNVLGLFDRPPRWSKDLNSLDDGDPKNNGLENGPFIVWMSTATFADFSKLYSVLKPQGGVMKKGRYSININYRYGVYQSSHARKTLRLESLGILGVNNTRLVLVLGGLSLIYVVFFIIIFLVWRRSVFHVQGLDHEP